MSWSVDGSIRRPVEAGALVDRTREVLRELLATDDVPQLRSSAPAGDGSFTVLLPSGDGAEVLPVRGFVDYSADEHVETTALTVSSRHGVPATSVSTVLCIAIAVAAAELGGGSFFDENRGFVLPAGAHGPGRYIAETRLAPDDLTFDQRCERYLAPR